MFFVGSPNNIVDANVIIISQPHEKIYGDCSNTFFVSSVDFSITVQNVCHILLRQIVVNSQIFQPLKYHNVTS